jgi:hypothetical protein
VTFFSFRWKSDTGRPSRRLSSSARGEQLERRLALSIANETDVQSIAASLDLGHPQSLSCGCPGCALPAPSFMVAQTTMEPAAVAIAPLDETFRLQSRPGATKSIYLDFDGHTTEGTFWNTLKNLPRIVTPAYSVDSDAAFSPSELVTIQNVWARVAEAFSPFDVNVTTQEPDVEDLRQFGAGDTRWGVRVVVGPDVANFGGGGFAQLGSFSSSIDVPAFVFSDRFGEASSKYLANAITHEVGHTLGLLHDGTTTTEYYDGHGGTGKTSWAPIMGSGYSRQVVQWSRGEYSGATNHQDDLAVITGSVPTPYTPLGNGFGFRPDDHGDAFETATEYGGAGLSGVIEQPSDVDLFRFTTDKTIVIDVQPAPLGPMLDMFAEIIDANGAVLSTSNPPDSLAAAFSIEVTPGVYFLRISGAGKGDPGTTGYSKYGSLGQYTVSIVVDAAPPAPPVVEAVSTNPVITQPAGIQPSTPAPVVTSVVPIPPVSTVAPQSSGVPQSIAALPSAPELVFASGVIRRPRQTSVVVGWRQPAGNEGGEIRQYVIRFRVAGTGRWQTLRVAGNATAVTIPGVAPNKIYEFRVAAVTSAGPGPFRSSGLVRLSALPRL